MNPNDSALVPRIDKTIRLQRLFRPGDTLVVAISGGADSTALLDLLSRLADYNLRLIAVHLNHCLRGDESDADQEFCRLLAVRYAIPFEVKRIDIKKMAEENRLNLEDAGRRARIEFLNEISSRYGAVAVVLAHHADDQAETVLMRLLRGSGMTGLSGMSYRNALGYVRPLLDITRADIEQYLRGRGLDWREDASNSDTVYLRNRIRHQLLPLLEQYNPDVRATLAASASIISGDETLLAELADKAFAESCRLEEGRVVGSIVHLRALNPALRRRVLRLAIKMLAGSLEGVSLCHIDAVGELIDSARPNSSLDLPHGVVVVREYDSLIFSQVSDTRPDADFELQIIEPGSYQLPTGGYLAVEILHSAKAAKTAKTADSVCIDLAKIPLPWLVRTFSAGDRMTPFGMSGRKKVKDIFIDRKIPLSERRRIPLLYSGDNLIWIAGVCASELSRIDDASEQVLLITWHRY